MTYEAILLPSEFVELTTQKPNNSNPIYFTASKSSKFT